jgi:hypothetical protein
MNVWARDRFSNYNYGPHDGPDITIERKNKPPLIVSISMADPRTFIPLGKRRVGESSQSLEPSRRLSMLRWLISQLSATLLIPLVRSLS